MPTYLCLETSDVVAQFEAVLNEGLNGLFFSQQVECFTAEGDVHGFFTAMALSQKYAVFVL